MLRAAAATWRASFAGLPRAVWLLALVSLVNRCGGMVLAFLALYLKEALHFGLGEIGYITACFGVGAIAGAFAGGWLTDRFGYFAVQFGSLALNGVLLIALLEVKTFWPMIAFMLMLGFITEVFRPANSVAVLRASSASNRTRAYSLVRLSFNIGWTVAPAIGGVVAYYLGWAWLFWADGLTCLAAAAFLWWRVPRDLGAASAPASPSQAAPFASATAGEAAATIAPSLAASPRSAWQDRPFVLFWWCTFLGAMVFLPIVWSVPIYYKDVFGWTEAQIGGLAALNGAIVALVEMPLVFGLEAKWSPLRLVRFGMGLYAISYVCLLTLDAQAALVAGLGYTIAISFGEIFVMPFSSTWVSVRADAAAQGQYLAMYSLAYAVANVLAPLLGMHLAARFGYGALWLACIGMSGAAMLGLAVLRRSEHHGVVARTLHDPSQRAES
ncbi:MAG: MFS transporter [Myxococcales bacterium]|nr:MFS transporter [Myxococcales bacterium]